MAPQLSKSGLLNCLRYAFIVEYKKGKDNLVADAVSRKIETEDCVLDGDLSSQDGVLFAIVF